MRKSKRGFTLVELLAVIVILGIMFVFAIPAISRLVGDGRNKMYVTDAKKLVSQAEYKLAANNTTIDTPDPGDCIIVTLEFLYGTDFDNPPNDGEYLKDNSFVIIKNDDGNMEYSVTIVEKTKDNEYRGIGLIKSAALKSNDASKYITTFKESDLLIPESLTINKINNTIGDSNYLSSDGKITAIYNKPILADDSYRPVEDASPVVTSSKISSSSGSYNTVDAILTLNVKDEDTQYSDLKVSVSFKDNNGSIVKYKTKDSYGSNSTYSLPINFSNYGYANDSGAEIVVKVVVYDTQGNNTTENITYNLRRDMKPVIDTKSSISKRSNDKVNMTTALLKLIVEDEEGYDNLRVCLKDDASKNVSDGLCNEDEYVPYNSLFSGQNTTEYTFKTCGGNGCSRNGKTYYLHAFVKDRAGNVADYTFNYKLSQNVAPKFDSQILVERDNTEYNTSAVRVKVLAIDEISPGVSEDAENIKLQIKSDGKVIKETRLSDTRDNFFYFDLNCSCDGKTRNISVNLIDADGEMTESNPVAYKVHKNEAPKITSFKVDSDGLACNNGQLCPVTDGGSKNIIISTKVSDDLDSFSNLKMCVSTNQNDCANDNNYINYESTYEMTLNDAIYDGSSKTFYLYVKDSYNEISNESTSYSLYNNKKPHIESFIAVSVDSEVIPYGNLDVTLSASIMDDFDDISELSGLLVEDGVEKALTSQDLKDINGDDNRNYSYRLNGDYDGGVRNLTLYVTDKNGKSAAASTSYTVYYDSLPEITQFELQSSEDICVEEDYCTGEVNSLNAEFTFMAGDDVTDFKDLKVCLSDTSSSECNSYEPITNYFNLYEATGEYVSVSKTWVFSPLDINKPYDGSVKYLTLFVKDNAGGVSTKTIEYNIYNNQKPRKVVDSSFTEVKSDNDILGKADGIYTVKFRDDLTRAEDLEIKYCYKFDGNDNSICTEYIPYTETNEIFDSNSEPQDNAQPKNSIRLNKDNLFSDINSYNGEILYIYSVVKDSYGEESASSSTVYKLYQDLEPEITLADAKIESSYYINQNGERLDEVPQNSIDTYTLYYNLNVYFNVYDYYDTYSVCFSKSNSSCTDYKETYDGSDKVGHNLNYLYETSDWQNSSGITLYLFVKDSHNKIVKKELNPGNRGICENIDTNNVVYQYSPVNENNKITIDRCSGKCYSKNPITGEANNITAIYKRREFAFDLFSSDTLCNVLVEDGNNTKPKEEEISVDCSFKDCFLKNNNYERKAIGLYEVSDFTPWTYTERDSNGNIISSIEHSHYTLYTSSYRERELTLNGSSTKDLYGDKKIVLTPTPNKMCVSSVDSNKYNYDSTSNDPYVRVDDVPKVG